MQRLELTFWAFLLSLSFYSSIFGFLAWVSLVRPIQIMIKLKGREAFNGAYFFYFLFNLFTIYWVAMVTPPGMIAAVVILGFYGAIVLSLFIRAYRLRSWLGFALLPFLWTGLEYFRTLSEFGFPWSDLGYTQSYYLYLIQIVSIISAHGLSFLIVTVNVLICLVFRRDLSAERRLTSGLITLAIVAGLTAFGWVVVPKFPPPGNYGLTMLQGSVPLDVKWAKGNQEHSYALYDSLTMANLNDSLTRDSTHLYIWPETSAPTYLTHDNGAVRRIGGIALRSQNYHLVGSLGATVDERGERTYNSCYQISPSGRIEQRHDKMKLVPFAEHVPYQDHFSILQKDVLTEYLTFIKTYDIQWWSDFYTGDSITIFQLPDAAYAVLICFETTFPEYVRQTILDGAEFLVGITNDTWFGASIGIHMHSRIFITRAIENRVWAARTANSGLTYIVDNYGRVRESLELFEIAALTGKVNRLDEYSFFTRYGDIAGKLSFLITLLLGGILVVQWIWSRPSKSKF
ncbi:MAG: apolipoprotein N-acyltransferase [bacterium]|nr:apolipoprotein N-acyltransferase [bacterium]